MTLNRKLCASLLVVTCALLAHGQVISGAGGVISGSGGVFGNISLNFGNGPFIGENAPCTGNTDATCFQAGIFDGPAELPRTGMYTAMGGTPATGPVVTVSLANLQATVNSAVCGEVIQVNAQVSPGVQSSQQMSLSLPNKGCTSANWIWIVSDQYQNQVGGFPAEHQQITPCAINTAIIYGLPGYTCLTPSFLVPQIIAINAIAPPIFPAAGAAFYRIIGFEIIQPNTFNNGGSGLVDFENGADHIILDRVLIHGQPSNCSLGSGIYTCTGKDLKNGVLLGGGTNIAVLSSWLWNIDCTQRTCSDSHAFGGGNSNLPSHTYKLWNNMIMASGENFIQGGAGDGSVNVVTPTDFDIRANWFLKNVLGQLQIAGGNGCGPATCGGSVGPEVKNNFELKNASRVLLEGDVFENNWTGWQTDQHGEMMHLNPFNQNIAVTQTVTSDGAGNETATSGTFQSACACTATLTGLCQITIATVKTHVLSCTNSTHIVVQAPFPPAGTGQSSSQCKPGLNPVAVVTDGVVRWSDFRNGTSGLEVDNPLSDCQDFSLATTRFSFHDLLFQGITDINNNGNTANGASNSTSRCINISNAESASVTGSVTVNHITCAQGKVLSSGFAGLDSHLDQTNSTTNGSTGSYISNIVVENSIGPAGGQFTNANGLYPGGALAGLKQQSCTPPVTSTTCSWTYTRNVLGLGQWPNQVNNSPFPSTNQTCGNSGNPTATCFPSGAAFTSLFVAYNSSSGQPGYRGDYHLAPSGAYNNAGTDGKDLGVSDIDELNTVLAGVRGSGTVDYASPTILTTTLPNATHGVAYSFQLAGTGASDFLYWRVTGGALCSGFTLPNNGLLTSTIATVAGSCSFTVTVMDAGQQYATQNYTLTVN